MLGFCLSFGVAEAAAQYRIDQWTADDGLPQNSVYEILQTGDGYLWMATVDGLARFDGVQFTVFSKSNSPGIVNNRFISLFENNGGSLWAGTEESGVVRYRGGRFENFGRDSTVPPSVTWIESDETGEGAIFHGPETIVRFHNESFMSAGEPSLFTLQRPERHANIKIICRYNVETTSSECFVNGRWIRFALDDASPPESFVPVVQKTNAVEALEVRFLSAAQQADGTIWLITADGRLARTVNGRAERIYGESDGLPGHPLYLIYGSRLALVARDADDDLWLVDLPSMQKELLVKKGTSPFPMDKLEFLSTYSDSEGNLWFGTKRDGLLRARKQVITAYSEAEGIIDRTVYPVYQDRTGTIWIGGAPGLFKREGDRFEFVASTNKFIVNSIAEDHTGRILISNSDAMYALQGDEFVPFEPDKITANGFIYAIHSDRENALWIGSAGGLRRLKDGAVTSFTTDDGLAGNDVKVIIDSIAGGLWIGTYNGLTRYENGRLTSWRESDGLPSRTVRALYEEADGTLWIGSYDGGLARFKDGKFTRYNMKTGLPNDGAFQILEDDRRNFWISSNRGIYRVSKDELNDVADGRITRVNSIAYGKSDGMLNPECNGGRSPAGMRDREGNLWFPTQDGVAVIDPRELRVNAQPPPVVIEGVRVDNADLELTTSTIQDEKNADAPDRQHQQIRIEPSRQNFEISYTALSFINSENLRFKYKLEGLDDEWVDAGTRRQAYFSHVRPGEYTFRVIAANSDNIWNETGAALNIVVLPPFYSTWWFMMAAVAAVCIVAGLLVRQRLRQIDLKHAEELAFSRRLIDSQEQERKRFAAEMHDGLGQSLVMIKNRARLSLKQSGEPDVVTDHLENISATASHAINEAREIAFNLRPHLLDRLGLTKTIESMLDKVFTAGEIDYEADIDAIDGVLEKNSEILLYRIVQEGSSNIVKHARAAHAHVEIKRLSGGLRVKIADNGAGFDAGDHDAVLQRRSFGLVGISERTRLLGGRLNIESRPGEGTTLTIVIDLPREI